MSHSPISADLHIQFAGYWHAGSGRGSGNHLDALCERDEAGLPYFPGRQLKGILRHAVRRAESWGWLREFALPDGVASHEQLLFGSESQSESRHGTEPGLLQVESAALPEPERSWLAEEAQVAYRAQLFAEIFSTAIDESGAAKAHSLRGSEVCLPVSLHALLQLRLTALVPEHRVAQQQWLGNAAPWAALEAALPLVDALGAHRSRGLGEAVVVLRNQGGARS